MNVQKCICFMLMRDGMMHMQHVKCLCTVLVMV
jgi:hypothetical protein